jgi:hypothetical protein
MWMILGTQNKDFFWARIYLWVILGTQNEDYFWSRSVVCCSSNRSNSHEASDLNWESYSSWTVHLSCSFGPSELWWITVEWRWAPAFLPEPGATPSSRERSTFLQLGGQTQSHKGVVYRFICPSTSTGRVEDLVLGLRRDLHHRGGSSSCPFQIDLIWLPTTRIKKQTWPPTGRTRRCDEAGERQRPIRAPWRACCRETGIWLRDL